LSDSKLIASIKWSVLLRGTIWLIFAHHKRLENEFTFPKEQRKSLKIADELIPLHQVLLTRAKATRNPKFLNRWYKEFVDRVDDWHSTAVFM